MKTSTGATSQKEAKLGYIKLPTNSTVMTVKIIPVNYDVNKTLILPPGTNQVAIALETSTNLVNWSTATNGIYGSPDEARFFRIHMQTQ